MDVPKPCWPVLFIPTGPMRYTSSGFVLRSVETSYEKTHRELAEGFRQNLERMK